jgi:hypothetical protein
MDGGIWTAPDPVIRHGLDKVCSPRQATVRRLAASYNAVSYSAISAIGGSLNGTVLAPSKSAKHESARLGFRRSERSPLQTSSRPVVEHALCSN